VSTRSLLLSVAAFAIAAAAIPAQLSAQVDVIRGHVIGPDGQPLEQVRVTATSIPGNLSRQTRTDKKGAYQIAFPNGEGDYFMGFAIPGYQYRQFELKRIADEDVLIGDAKMSFIVLDTVVTTVQQQQRVPAGSTTPDVSGTDRAINNAALPPDMQGDLMAMAASLPGVLLIPGVDGAPDGFSVLGLGADQNSVTMNGLSFNGSTLPRDAAISTSLSTSSYDVSKGGYSGGQLSVRSGSGSNYRVRGNSFLLNSPHLEWTDQAGQALGNEFSNYSLSGMASGPLSLNKTFYNVSYQLTRRASDLQTLLNTGALGLQTSGIAVDSVTRLLNILQGAGIPASVGRSLQNTYTDGGSVFGSMDFISPTSSTAKSFNLTFSGNWGRTDPTGGSNVGELPSHKGDQSTWGGSVQGRHTSYFGLILSESSVGVNQSHSDGSPFLELPSGRVRVNSTLSDGRSGLMNVSFGGNPGLDSKSTNTGASFQNTLSWFSDNNKHRVKLTTELNYTGYSQDQSSNLLGSFSYNSLADLEAGKPASFSRQLNRRQRSGGSGTLALSLGDSYRRTPTFQLQYGLRLDAGHSLNTPDYNPAVESAFGVRNDYVPNKIYASPRIGFSWTYGQDPQIAAFMGAAPKPRATVRGGIVVNQNATTSLGSALDNTGLPSGVQTLNCVGVATPVPDWDAYALNASSVPDHCVDGTGGTVFANTSPNVSLFSREFGAQRSVRTNLSWAGVILKNRFNTNIEGTYSWNMNQQRQVDLNFSPVTRFNLTDEGGRPVFVQTASIVPTTGSIASRDARVNQGFSRVTETRSDLRSDSRQINFSLRPVYRSSTALQWSASYVYSNNIEQVAGFSSTVGNPLDVTWARSGASQHQFSYSLGYNVFGYLQVSWSGSFRSGSKFTPTISGDVNGDGYSNDRAFVFNPATAADPVLAASMTELLNHTNDATRACLTRQLGQLAARNSCQGPWSTSGSLNITLDRVKMHMPQRANIQFSLSNPLGAADLITNGSGHLKGWGQGQNVDQQLLYVRGFDAQTQRYKYEVNQRFGPTRPTLTTLRQPVTLTATVKYDFGPTREKQTLVQRLDPGRSIPGSKLPEVLMKSLGTSGMLNPLSTILSSQDSLHLTAMQADSIAAMNRRYTYRVDSLWTPVARYWAGLPERYNEDEAYDRFVTARHAAIDMLDDMSPVIKKLLTAEQKRKLSSSTLNYLDSRFLASIRNGTAMYIAGGGGGSPAALVGLGAVDRVRIETISVRPPTP
jgi:hypothetical protein